MKLVVFRPEGAQDLAQGKRHANRQGRAALGMDVPVTFSRPNGARENCCILPFQGGQMVCVSRNPGRRRVRLALG